MTPSPSLAQGRAVYESVWLASQGQGWRLSYPEPLESDYQSYYAVRYRSHMGLGLAVGTLAILISWFEDFLIPADQRLMPMFIRFGLVLPSVLLLLFLIMRPAMARWQQSILMLSTIGGATAFLLMAFFVSSPLGRIYIETLMLILIFGLALLRMQFAYALACVVVIIGGAMAALLSLPFPGSRQAHLIDLMLIVFAGLLCLVANYLIERSARGDYVQQRLLEFRQQDLEASNSHLQQLLRSDGLTGIANRRHFDQRLSEEFRRAERGAYPLALLMLDIDAFKQYNDTYGHQAGDETLTKVAQTLAIFARRPGDVAARYGGEEFALILPGSSEAHALAVAEEVVLNVFEQGLPHKSSRVSDRITVSIGVASAQPGVSIKDPAELVANADQALYFAKGAGRNRARSWSALEKG
jgi:diguanylate cyclase (GGDEF)-like protein